MKKLLTSLFLSSLFIIPMYAQNEVNSNDTNYDQNDTETVSETEKEKKTSKFNHWSIGIQGGMTLFDGDQSQKPSRIVPYSQALGGGGLNVEYTFNPRVGIFAQYSFYTTEGIATYYPDQYSAAGSQKISFQNYIHNVSLNASVNLITLLGKCYSNPKWNAYFNIGAGVGFYNISVYDMSDDKKDYALNSRNNYTFIVPMGFSLEYTPVKWLGIFWNTQYNFYFEDDLDASIKGNKDDGVIYTGLGLNFKFTTKGKQHVRNISWCQFADKDNELEDEIKKLQKRMADAEDDIKDLNEEVDSLKKRKPVCPPTLTEADVERMIGKQEVADCEPPSIYFNINSYQFTPEAEITIAQVAQRMYTHKNLKVTIKGYCDYTGSEAYNETLSKERAEHVKNVLVKTYGIEADRISTEGMGRTMGPKESYLPNRRCDFIFTNK